MLSIYSIQKMRPYFLYALTFLLWSVSSLAFACDDKSYNQFTWAQSKTASEVSGHLQKNHYRKLKLNDDLSQLIFQEYIDALDPDHRIFIASDVKEFDVYRNQLDNALKYGNLKPAYRIFSRRMERLCQLTQTALNNLEQYLTDIDKVAHKSILRDRSEAPWPKDLEAAKLLWQRQIQSSMIDMRLNGLSDEKIVDKLERRFKSRLRTLKNVRGHDVFSIFLNTFSQVYDPHTSYFLPYHYENFNISMSLSLEGIGVTLEEDDGYIRVVDIIEGGPTDQQNALSSSDRIIGVGQGEDGEIEDVFGWRIDEVVQLIRGPKDTKVRLEIIPANAKNEEETRYVVIERGLVKLEQQAAKKSILDIKRDDNTYSLGVIEIPAFYLDFAGMQKKLKDYRSTAADVAKLMEEMQNEDKVDGIILDLRGNSGGALVEVTRLAGLFLDKGTVVQVAQDSSISSALKIEKVENREKSISANEFINTYTGPLVILIDRLSASASEILAGVIQDSKRGLIVGEQSYGKGTVQHLIKLTEGQLKLTRSKFYRVTGESTQLEGIEPDIIFPHRYQHDKIGERKLSHALEWDVISAVNHTIYFDNIPDTIDDLTELHHARIKNNPDFQYIKEYSDLLKLQEEKEFISLNEQQREQEKIQFEQQELAITNRWRVAKGKEALESLDNLLVANEESNAELLLNKNDVDSVENNTPNNDLAPAVSQENNDEDGESNPVDEKSLADAQLIEAANILIDSLSKLSWNNPRPIISKGK